MVGSLRALMSGIVDYAGLFPPARLPLETAIRNYAHYRASPAAWMLGRFVCPAIRLPELEQFSALFAEGPPFLFSVLGRGGEDSASFLEGLRADVGLVQTFRRRHGARISIDALEVKLPELVCTSEEHESLDRLLAQAGSMCREARLLPAYEGPALQQSAWRPVVSAIARFRSHGGQAVFKWRAGGLDAAAFPSVAEVAGVLDLCRREKVPCKATAGLHHPLRRVDPTLSVVMHGFVNVFVAGVFAEVCGLSLTQVREIVEEQDPEAFSFEDAGLAWRDLRASTEEVAAARRERVLSFGSCSFDEPREDLRALGWMGD